MIQYISTRGQSPNIAFGDAILRGLAPDGGLYLPDSWPELTKQDIFDLKSKSYQQVAFAIISRFVGDDIKPNDLKLMIKEAYDGFDHPSVCPLMQLDYNFWVMEQFRGPTLAFKDVALRFLASLMDHLLGQREQKANIIVATSGDTGSAAMDAFQNRDNINLFVLLPKGRVSEVQRRQMTTPEAKNVHALIIDGNFDDCQNLVKAMFADENFRQKVKLSGVNSINWGRIIAQSVYYASACLSLGDNQRAIDFCVPTGNFGNIFAGYVAKKLGFNINSLLIASNENDILPRSFETGRHELRSALVTQSPSMDIQISSNFERFLFEMSGRDSALVNSAMNSLKQSGAYDIPAEILGNMKSIMKAAHLSEAQTSEAMREVFINCNYLMDPHSAIGYGVAKRLKDERNNPLVTLATAHPAKFQDAVKAATGISPKLPEHMQDLFEKPERYTSLDNDLHQVQTHILYEANF